MSEPITALPHRPIPPPVNVPDAVAPGRGRRDAIVVDVDDRPIPVQIAGRLFEFRGIVTTGEIAATLGPLREQAATLDPGNMDALAGLTTTVQEALAEFLDDPAQRDDWLALRLPLPALMSTTQPSVLNGLMAEWTGGRPLDNA